MIRKGVRGSGKRAEEVAEEEEGPAQEAGVQKAPRVAAAYQAREDGR